MKIDKDFIRMFESIMDNYTGFEFYYSVQLKVHYAEYENYKIYWDDKYGWCTKKIKP